ncbi:MAG: AglZ/HisF2 family acetamidino modification protein [Verrucomicrobia bacterium]|nr:AglZ/HisF2 family acetamidino modification protein [Verrucomicrobiota bacterium]
MRRIRVIPVLLLDEGALVKTVQFRKPRYIGDPINAVRIFNRKQVDELIVLDISAERRGSISFDYIEDIVSEAFMPVAYGGGIQSLEDARKLLQLGVEKLVLNTAAIRRPHLIRELTQQFGSQSVVVSIDVKTSLFGASRTWIRGGRENTGKTPLQVAQESVSMGAGEIFLTAIHKEGTFHGFDLPLLTSVASKMDVPVIAHGGARDLKDFRLAVKQSGCSAVAAGSLFVYAKRAEGVLINYPSEDELMSEFWSHL